MKKTLLTSILTVCALSFAQITSAQVLSDAEEERCTSAKVNMFGIEETMTVCSDGSGSLRRRGIGGSYECLIVWNSSGREIFNDCR